MLASATRYAPPPISLDRSRDSFSRSPLVAPRFSGRPRLDATVLFSNPRELRRSCSPRTAREEPVPVVSVISIRSNYLADPNGPTFRATQAPAGPVPGKNRAAGKAGAPRDRPSEFELEFLRGFRMSNAVDPMTPYRRSRRSLPSPEKLRALGITGYLPLSSPRRSRTEKGAKFGDLDGDRPNIRSIRYIASENHATFAERLSRPVSVFAAIRADYACSPR